jgi:hypothetical protein
MSADGRVPSEESDARPPSVWGSSDDGAGSAGDPARERRVKALALTAPLHELEQNKALRGWQVFDCYDLALAAIDAVVDRMGFDSGIRRTELDAAITQNAARFVPDADQALHRDVAVHIIESLIRPQHAVYEAAADGRRRRFDFRLLDEVDSGDGIYVRATDAAINVLVGALDTDLESAHEAAEARFESLIKRRRLPEAAIAAKEARYRSIQYMIEVGRYIAETRRDYRRAGWHEQIPTRLAEMVEHLKGRLDTERRMLAAMREARDEADREDHRRQAADLVGTVEDCFVRHSKLHVQLMEAERAFFEEQDRQAFAWARATRGTREITDELLVPLLEMTVDDATSLLVGFAERMWPPQAPVVARLGAAVALLLRPPQDHDVLGEEIEEVEYDEPVMDPRVFDDATWAATDSILDGLDPDGEPVRLSELIARARAAGGDLTAELIRLRVMTAVAPLFDQLLPRGPSILAAGVDGIPLPDGPLWGDDLLVGRLAPDDDAFRERQTDEPHDPLAEPVQLPLIVRGEALS